MIKTTVLAAILALAMPFAAQAETEKYSSYQASCDAETCSDFNVTYDEAGEKVAQTRRTRTRRTRSRNRLFKDFYVGGGAGLFFGDNLDTGFQGNVFAGSKYNEFIGADVEFTFGFADIENIDESITILGLYFNPRFEYQFENSSITGYISPGIGLARFSGFGDSDTELDFQIKAGASIPLNEKYEVFAQGRYQDEAEAFGIEGGIVFDISK